MTAHNERYNTIAQSQSINRHNGVYQMVKPFLLAIATAALIGCDSGGSNSPGNSTAAGNDASPCYNQIQESLTSYGTPDEIRENSITFDDGSMMLIEEHVYSETRLVRSFGYKVEDIACTTWEEGLTI